MKREIKDKKELYKLVAYLVMGDGGVYYSGKNCRFVLNTASKNFCDYADSIISNVTSTNIRKINDLREENNRKPSFCLMSKSHPLFTQMRERIYTGNYRGLDPHYLKILDWESLAILYMSDGNLYIDKRWGDREYFSVSLGCKRLSYGDQFILKKFLEDRLELTFNINRHYQYYLLRLRSKDNDKFFSNISEYILNDFNYKLPESFRKQSPQVGDDIV